MPFSKSKAATKIQSLFRAAKPRRKYRTEMKRRAWTQKDFYQNEKFRNSRHMRPPALPRGRGPGDVGYYPAHFRHITRAMRVAMFRRRAAADYKYFEKTKKRRNIYRGGAFFS